MKVLKPFFLGAAAGLVLAVVLAVGAYVSPLREKLYLHADPELAGLRQRLEEIREGLAQDELAIAAAPAGDPLADSLKAARAGALKEYRHRRNRMGELSRLHDRASPAGFAPWALSLRAWLLPGAGLLVLLPALLSAAAAARRSRRRPARVARPVSAQAEALMSFENAVRQVALLSPSAPVSLRTARAKPGLPLPGVPVAPDPSAAAVPAPPSAPAPVADAPAADAPAAPTVPEASPYDAEPALEGTVPLAPVRSVLSPFASVADADVREPETSEFPLEDAGAGAVPGSPSGALPAGTETRYLDLGPGWGTAHPIREAAPVRGLSMEDEEAAEAQPDSGTQNRFMPPTTEVERVERRKAEVLKLARKGLTSSEISRRMRISQDQVEFIIRMRREKG